MEEAMTITDQTTLRELEDGLVKEGFTDLKLCIRRNVYTAALRLVGPFYAEEAEGGSVAEAIRNAYNKAKEQGE
jgi:hypothetical protein